MAGVALAANLVAALYLGVGLAEHDACLRCWRHCCLSRDLVPEPLAGFQPGFEFSPGWNSVGPGCRLASGHGPPLDRRDGIHVGHTFCALAPFAFDLSP